MGIDKEPPRIFHLHNDQDVKVVAEIVGNINASSDRPWVVKIGQDDESRSQKQNRLSFLWYGIIGGSTNEGRMQQRHYCKLLHGCPILMEDKDFNQFYLSAIGPLTYEQQLDAMEYVPVTSSMTTRQFAEYLEAIDKQALAQGVVLPRPEDLYWNALMKEAERR